MADIRSFFTSKGGAANKPAPAKSAERPKTQRSKGRKIVEDSDDDDPIEQAKPPSKPTFKKIKTPLETKGVEISADDYFVSTAQASKSKPTQSATAETGADITNEGPVRSSPRGKKAVFTSTSATFRNSATAEKRSTANELHHVHDNDASMETAEEYGEETHESKMKGRNKREKDDYIEEEPREGAQTKSKRVATRGRPPSGDTGTNTPQKKAKTAVAGRKRRSASLDSHSEDKPRKRQLTPRKVQTPSAKKKTESEESEIQKIFDSVATIRAPTPPPKDANSKFDWRKAAAGGGNASVQPTQAAALPEGQEECLSGLSFVFTGILQQIGREEAQALVKRYGGKVTGQPSSKTSFVVLGEDAGPSKLAKIKAHGLRKIDENGLFDLIRKLPAFGGSGAGAQKAQEKKKAEEEKVKKQVAEMEAEERAIKAEETKAAQRAAATSRGRSVAAAPAAAQKNGQLLTSKYAPTQMSHICGNKAQVERIQSWLRNWPKSKKHNFQRRGADGLGGERALIISGPPGIGKTTSAHLAAKLEGYDVLESNASDTRSKRLVEAGLSEVMKNTSLLGYFAGDGKTVDASKKKLVLIMDEVDGMSAGDRGGVGALVQFCRKTWVPLILICNERRLPKMKPFDHVAFDVRFNRPTVEQVRSRIMTVCHREGLRLPPPVVDALIEGSNKDIRQIINMISTAKFDQASMNFDEGKAMSKAWEKHVVLKPWDICQKMLGGGLFMPTSKATLNDKIELYFNDHEFSFLMIQENYLRTKPLALKNQGYTKREEQVKALELFDRAAESISDGDLVDRMIHGPQQHWSLMPTHAVFSTVRPASFIAGQLVGSNFTSWLGNFSKSGKLGRYVRQMHSHMRLRSSGDHNEIRQQYLPVLWERMVNRLQNEGVDAVTDVIQLMDSYFLTRDDFDAIKELGIGPMAEEQVTIETKTKAAFTRIYNLMVHPVPFMKASNVLAPKKLTKEAPDLEEAIEEEDEAELVEAAEVEDDEVDVSKDKYIKQPKPKKTGKKSGKATVADREDDKPKRRGKTNKGTK